MSPDARKLLIIFGTLIIVIVAAFTAAGAYIHRCGMMTIYVDEGCDGSNIRMKVPAALVQGALQVIPNELLEDAACEMGEYAPIAVAVCEGLEDSPDFVLCEVNDGDESVLIEKIDKDLVINVRDNEDKVHVVVPFRMITSVIKRIEAAQKPI